MSATGEQKLPTCSWIPYKEAYLDKVEVGARRRNLSRSRFHTHVIDVVPPKRKRVDRAWRRAEKWCEKANAALMEERGR